MVPLILRDTHQILSMEKCVPLQLVLLELGRRKSEMILVRTDGFSCTREKVRDTSLAFEHPSAQLLQMHVRKSPSKTVLLLKKLGDELLEEVKEIPYDARSNAWLSLDSKRRQQLSGGDSIDIYVSKSPLLTVNKSGQTGDFFRSLIRTIGSATMLQAGGATQI